jgi:hypothetical protein
MGEIGREASRFINVKLKVEVDYSLSNKEIDIPITLEHECLYVDLAGKQIGTYTYQILKDGTKNFSLDSFTFSGTPPANA